MVKLSVALSGKSLKRPQISVGTAKGSAFVQAKSLIEQSLDST